MKKFLLKVILFFACVVVMDFAFGFVFSRLRSHAKGGNTANNENIANRVTDDIIILGSSRATHHYVSQIIEDSLGMSCYNCGEEGNGIILAYGRFQMLTDRYYPKLIIYEITPEYDWCNKDPNSKYLGYLRPYYDKEGVKKLFDVFDGEFSQLKMVSRMYQNTAKLLPNLIDNVIVRDNKKGYAPLEGIINLDKNGKAKPEETIEQEIDSLKLQYMERIIVEAQSMNIPIVFMISPKYGGNNNLSIYEPAISLCNKYDIQYYNYLNYEPIANEPELFQDIHHMNNQGAFKYTQLLINEVLNEEIK